MIFLASQLLLNADELVEGGGLRVQGGRIAGVYRSLTSARRAARTKGERTHDLGEGLLTPGLVNAHAHLDLTGFEGRLSGGAGFVPWIGSILKERAPLVRSDFESAVRSGAVRLLQSGTTAVGDIDSSGAAPEARRAGLRSVVYRELLDAWDPARTKAALAGIARPPRAHDLLTEGVSPHAPYTTSPELLAGIARIARRRRLAVAVHWSETEEEVRWLTRGAGPFARVLPAMDHIRGLELLEKAGLLGRRTTLIHGNYPARGEPGVLAAAGVCVVHCPGTHAFFGREPFPWRRYDRAGVTLALGTDSLASNVGLDMRAEMKLASETLTGLSPERIFRMGTSDAARAIGLETRVGSLARGRFADFALFAGLGRGSRRALLEALLGGQGHVQALLVGGRSIPVDRP